MQNETIESAAILIVGIAMVVPFVFVTIKAGRFVKDLEKERREEFIRSLTGLTE